MQKNYYTIIIIIALVIFTGCSGKSKNKGKSADSPSKVVETFTQSLQKQDFKTAWDCLSTNMQKMFEDEKHASKISTDPFDNFKKIMAENLKGEKSRLEITSAVVDKEIVMGDKAIVKIGYTRFEDPDDSGPKSEAATTITKEIPLSRTNGHWKIDIESGMAGKTDKSEKK